jgi:hypothetical protein
VDERASEELFRAKVLGLLRRRGLLSQDRTEQLLSWRRSGFSVHNRVFTGERANRRTQQVSGGRRSDTDPCAMHEGDEEVVGIIDAR